MVDSATIKPALDLAGREVILGFGLLGPDKGYELVIDALPAVVAARPTASFVVLGATHPDQLAGEGEAYRRSLEDRVERLGLRRHVPFVDRFVGRVELTRWLEAADVVVTPYPDLDQVVAGTLSYAMGAGRAIVSTPYAHRRRAARRRSRRARPARLSRGVGRRAHRAPENDELRAAVGRRAHERSRSMIWSTVATQYRSLFSRVAAGSARARPLPGVAVADPDAAGVAGAGPRHRGLASLLAPVRTGAAHGDIRRAGLAGGPDGMCPR